MIDDHKRDFEDHVDDEVDEVLIFIFFWDLGMIGKIEDKWGDDIDNNDVLTTW